MRFGTVLAALVAGWCAACGSPSSSAPDAPWTTTSLRTQSGKYAVVLALDPPSPAMGELFSVEAVVTDPSSGEPVETATVTLDALMPQHGHGMMTRPVARPGTCPPSGEEPPERCPHPGGRYRTDGFKFHMPGAWTVTVAVEGPRGRDTTSVEYAQPAALPVAGGT